jgi:hypothetical protein
VEVTYRRRFRGRLQDVAVGLVLLLDVVPAVAAHGNLPTSPPLAFATRAVADLLLLVAIVGIAATGDGFSGRRTTLTASADGLRERTGRTATQLEWGAVVLLSLDLEKGNPDYFTAAGRGGETVTCPARGVIWRGGRLGQQSISQEELAAIVMERSGVQLTIWDA